MIPVDPDLKNSQNYPNFAPRMVQRNHSYYAKLLLFGEYSILLGSSALSIPYSHFRAEFSFIHEDKYTDLELAVESQRLLQELLSALVNSGEYRNILDLDRFAKDLDNGMYLESTIPHSYGLGSSGAVVAAVYTRYALKKISGSKLSVKEMEKLRKIFSSMESFFHGTSSGIDPLAIYISQPLLIGNDKKPSVVGIPRKWQSDRTAIFLVDTGGPGKTNPLVPIFLEQFAPNGTMTPEAVEYASLTDQCIQHLLSGNINDFWNQLRLLSAFQLKYLQKMIPERMMKAWKTGLESGALIMKLCGSGGGGFLTAFAPDHSNALDFLKDNQLQHIPVYMANH